MTEKQEFLPRDPEKALRRVRDLLYDRLEVLRQCVPDDILPSDPLDRINTDTADLIMRGEQEWIRNILDMIERS